ncbi:MAG: hydantoinase/oxoprolinase family protein [Anaerolineales bacterium]|jgi:N-methylhydantoinase A
MRAAIDIGGTFTDVLLYDEDDGDLWAAKVASSSRQPAKAFMAGLFSALAAADSTLSEVDAIIHGTTLVTNALLEGKTAAVGLLVTEGFRDLLEIGRQQRPRLYDLMADRKAPLIHRHMVREIQERVGADGEAVVLLHPDSARDQIRALKESGAETLAVVLLFSFLNARNENVLCELAQEFFPKRNIFLSSQISPEFREYERASTTVVSAAVAPKVLSYMQEILSELDTQGGHQHDFLIMHSGGGTLPPKEALQKPHTMVESGPSAGIIASARLANAMGLDRVIAFDMGGTTAKAGLVIDGNPLYVSDYEVGGEMHHGGRARGSGYPVRFPMIDVAECGAGAGSIARIDAGGHLKVGPMSAGADPGPACYKGGGSQPTVTDAYLALGFLAPDSFLGGELPLDREMAAQALTEHVCRPLNMDLPEAASGIITLANASILRILRRVTIERGYDPRDFTLVAYGGAGPLHATMLAEEMAIQRVVIPQYPGLFSALGLLNTDISTDFVETVMETLAAENLNSLNVALEGLTAKAEAWFQRMEVPNHERLMRLSADLRYVRQSYELPISLPGAPLGLEDIPAIQARFHEAHAAAYGHGGSNEAIQIVHVRLWAIVPLAKPKPKALDPIRSESATAPFDTTRSVWFSEGYSPCRVFQRESLRAGHRITSPAIIQEKEATTWIDRPWQVRVDKYGHLIIDRD